MKDSIGDLATSLSYAYTSLKANVQPKLDDTQFEIQGTIHIQDHIAYINRVKIILLKLFLMEIMLTMKNLKFHILF